jgi:opacity protein-like surface antigen
MGFAMLRTGGCATAVTLMLLQPAVSADLGAPREMSAQAVPADPMRPFDGYYLRADVGVARPDFSGFSQADLSQNGGYFESTSIGTQPTFAIGIGRSLHQWLRIDLTGEYRSRSHLNAYDNLTADVLPLPGDVLQANTRYSGYLSSGVGLANMYIDLGNWRGFTPYIGGGIGFARNEISGLHTATIGSLTDAVTGAVITQATSATSPDHSQWDLAWALMAGFSYDLNDSMKLDVGYRYIDLGGSVSSSSGPLNCICGAIGQPLQIHDLSANEFRVGLRIPLDKPTSYDSPPPLK